tara:strand:- start:3640 stop:4029 length:390 start_codon:yes stop_codon:yes gene_type:complete
MSKQNYTESISGADIASWILVVLDSKQDGVGVNLIQKAASCISGVTVESVKGIPSANGDLEGLGVRLDDSKAYSDEPTIITMTEKEANLTLTCMQIAGWFTDMIAEGRIKLKTGKGGCGMYFDNGAASE